MATITEDYVSFKTAKLLKEKGFDEPCWFWYDPLGEFRRHYSEPSKSSPCYEIACPTLQMAMKWLREVHNVHILVEPNHDNEGLYNVHVKVGWRSNKWAGIGYNTYEQACEAAILYSLENLI